MTRLMPQNIHHLVSNPFTTSLVFYQTPIYPRLFLSIYVPNGLSSDHGSKKSVMVWIYGGGYYLGHSNMFDGSYIALTGDVIVVAINYRLNVFGFMTTWDSIAPGNYGIWDQIFALRWIKENIDDFGGDPESITIFGQSAGGFSVSLLSLIPIPINERLFHRVIAQSGAAVSHFAYNDQYKQHIKTVVKEVGCDSNSENSSALIKCLRQVPAEKFLNVSQRVTDEGNYAMVIPFAPRTDNDLIPDSPPQLLGKSTTSGQLFQSIDYMSGFTNGEGLASTELEVGNVSEGISTKYFCNVLSPKMSGLLYNSNTDISDAICKTYSVKNGEKLDNIEQIRKTVDMYGDLVFKYPVISTLNAHAGRSKRNTYQYVFSQPINSILNLQLPSWYHRARHGSDLYYLFGLDHFLYAKFINATFDEEDTQLADTMMKYWTNFAKTGNPNGDSLPVWPKYTADKMEYMDLELKIKATTPTEDFKNRMKLWQKVIPSIQNRIGGVANFANRVTHLNNHALFHFVGIVSAIIAIYFNCYSV